MGSDLENDVRQLGKNCKIGTRKLSELNTLLLPFSSINNDPNTKDLASANTLEKVVIHHD